MRVMPSNGCRIRNPELAGDRTHRTDQMGEPSNVEIKQELQPSRGKRASNPNSNTVARFLSPIAGCRAKHFSAVVVRSPSNYMAIAVSGGTSGLVAFAITVFHPLRHIAVHVIKPESVSLF